MQQTYLVAFAGYDQEGKWSMDREKVKVPSGIPNEDREARIKDILEAQRDLKNLTILTELQLDG